MTEINIKGDIVDNQTAEVYSFYGLSAVSPKGVADAIKSATDNTLDVQVASNGGDVFAASEIYTMLKKFSGTVNVEIQGLAASAASVIAMAGDKVSMSPTSMLMIHQAWSAVQGNKDDMAHESDVLDKIDNSIVPAYEAKTGMDHDDLLNLMAHETWLTATEAVDKGFADEVASFDSDNQLYAASTGMALSPQMIAKGRAEMQVHKAAPAPQHKPVDESTSEKHNSLVSDKLAILFGKDE